MSIKKSSMTSFAVKVKKRLIELDMTQRELAEELGMNEGYLTEILRGRRAGTKYKEDILNRLGIEDTDFICSAGERRGVI